MSAKRFTERLHKGYAQAMELSGPPLIEERANTSASGFSIP